MRFFRRSTSIGLTAYQRLDGRLAYARVDRRAAVPRLLAAGTVAVAGDDWTRALSALRGAGPVSLVLGVRDYRLRLIDAPQVAPEEIKAAVRWQIQDLLDFHPDDATLDVLAVPQPEHVTHARQLFVVAAKNAVIAEEMRIALAAGLNLTTIDIVETAQRNIAARLEKPGRALVVFALTAGGGLLTVTLDGELCMARHLDVGAGFLGSGRDEIAAERLTLEIQRTLDHFDRQFGGVPVDRLLLAPQGDLPGLRDGLARNLPLPIDVIDLAAVLDVAAHPEPVPADCFHAVGGALRAEETHP